MRLSLLIAAALLAGCKTLFPPTNPPPASRDSVRTPPRQAAPAVVRDTALEQRADRLQLQVVEKEAQVEDLQARLDDARREVVRAMAKLQSLATRAEAASGMAEAEIALQALRSNSGNGSSSAASPEINQSNELLQLATAEFDKQNYAGALYLATQSKNAATAGRGRVPSGDRSSPRNGEVPFALPLRLQTTGRANVREGPGANYRILFTLDAGAALTAYSYVDQWVKVTDDTERPGWIHQGLVGKRGGGNR
jgi:hypothetical protein